MKEKNFYKKNILFFSSKVALVLILCSLIIMFSFTFSCTSTDNSALNSNGDDATSNDKTSGTVEEESVSSDDEQTAETNESSTAVENDTDKEQLDEIEVGEITINVYYLDTMGEYLVGEARIVSSENKYIDTLNELMKLPIDTSLNQLVPDSTKINSVVIEDGLAKVDFSKEFLEDRIQSDTVDNLLIYSIVNTLTEFPEVNSVSFYIDGEKLDILGEIDIKDPIFRRSDLIK